MKRKALITGGVILVVIAAAAAAIKVSSGEQVDMVKASKGILTLTVEETGYVESVNDCQVQASQPAQVVELLVEAGDAVKPGDTLIRLESPELAAEAASARSQLSISESELQAAQLGLELLRPELKQAENNLSRKKTLLDSGAISQTDYEQAELQVTRLRNNLSQQQARKAGLNNQMANLSEMLTSLEEKIGDLQVVSPVNGIVLDLPVKTGQMVSPGTVLAEIGSDNHLQVRTELLSDEVKRVKKGQITRIDAPILDNQVISGKVSKIYPRAYEKISALGVIQRRVPVIIAIDESDNLQPGYEVRVGIETLRKSGVVLLPRESVRLNDDGNYRVLAVVNGRIEERPIEVGEKNQQVVEVIKGIKVGESVVRDGSLELNQGTRVRPIR